MMTPRGFIAVTEGLDVKKPDTLVAVKDIVRVGSIGPFTDIDLRNREGLRVTESLDTINILISRASNR
jgi:hypothetical protein